MGDIGQVLIKDTGVYFYTYWYGSELQKYVKVALAKRLCWDAPEYLARIIFDEMQSTYHFGQGTGLGIGTELHDGIVHPLIVIDCGNQEVVLKKGNKKLKTYSFEEFIKLGGD